MTDTDQVSNAIEEEVDLHKLILTIGHHWVMLVIFMFLGGLLAGLYLYIRHPSYQATAVISIDSSTLLNQISPVFLVQSDSIKSEIAKNLDVTQDTLSNVTVSTAKNEKNVINISAETDDPVLSSSLVNTWAKIAVQSINAEDEIAKLDIETAQQVVNSADEALLKYLYRNGLGDLTWADLVAITGAGDQPSTTSDNSKLYPSITSAQRIELANLVRQKNLAEWNFNRIGHSVLSNTVSSEHRAMIINEAEESERSDKLLTYLIIPMGVLCGFFLAVVIILIKDWWKNS